jgi:hypothetical protein
MFFLILLSVLQICFLPGFILFLFLNKRSNNPELLLVPVLTFGLSLIINYVIVTSLAYINAYTRLSLSLIIVAEFIFLAVVLVFKKLNIDFYLNRNMDLGVISSVRTVISERKSFNGLSRLILFLLASGILVYISFVLIFNIGKIFREWDAVFSWNRWAIEFYNNKIPSVTYHYPQLIPANWSISYVLCGYPLQFIPKAIMPLFLVLPVYSFIIIGLKHRSYAFIYSIFFLFQGFNRLYWKDGCVDVPVAFFSMLVLISLVMIRTQDNDINKNKQILLSAFFVCGAAVTKQAGLYIVAIYPLLLYILTKESYPRDSKRIFVQALFFLFLLILIVVPGYLYAEHSINKGVSASEISYVTKEIYHGASYTERLLNACSLFFRRVFTSRIIFIIAIIPFLISFADRTIRFLNLVFVIPYFLVWAFFFSYDLRNAAIMIPYFCLGIGTGLEIVLCRLNKLTPVNEAAEK